MEMTPELKREFLKAAYEEAEQLEIDSTDRPDDGSGMRTAAAAIAQINCVLWTCDTVDADVIAEVLEQKVPDPQIREYVRAGLNRAFKKLEMN